MSSPERALSLRRPSKWKRLATEPPAQCGVHLLADSPELRLELAIDDVPASHCAECWEREFGFGPDADS